MKVKKIGIVSLSSGILGESFIQHELNLGKKRLEEYGIEVVFLPHALKGLEFIKQHPECRAQDLLTAFQDDSIELIFCAIGGDDTYRLLPYLFEQDALKKVAKQKIFLGFSDTTINHLMLHKVGVRSFYGQAFLPDVCDLSKEMLSYTKSYFGELLTTGRIKEIRPSDIWYQEREDFSEKGLGVLMPSFPNQGFELLSGASRFTGQILGGCLESMAECLENSRYEDTVRLVRQYQLFPTLEEWKGKILLLETSEEQPIPERFQKMIQTLERYGLFDVVSGVLVGKPQNETYYDEYKEILLEELGEKQLPIVYNINVGHATPRCIIPFGIEAQVDVDEQVIRFIYE